ncbi:KRAB A domain containing protein [Echinococcus multilocularis]|uniref:KRAB A domain containing protein n=1 Tax=Echinococcus multilocularis TaxID=6211 RepID=A0A068Y7M8_ECHMU|nr:KRAB A domain containing protein [Echinococcus multilocularis]
MSKANQLDLSRDRKAEIEELRSTLVVADGIGKETWTVKFIACPELAWDVILGADSLRYTKAILNFAEGTFSTHKATGVNTDTSLPKDDADDICNALFEAAAIPMTNLDDLCAQLTHISNYEGKELRQLLLKYANIFSWQGVRLGRKNIVKHKIDTGEARPIWQPPRRIPPPLLQEVNRLVEEMLRDEVIKPSKSPWASPIACHLPGTYSLVEWNSRLPRRRLSANLQTGSPTWNTPQVPSPLEQGSTNYLFRNAQLRTQLVTVHHNKVRPYKVPLPVGYEDEVYDLTEDRRPPVRNLIGSS